MRKFATLIAATFIASSLFLADPALARAPKKYQVTGTVLEVTDDYIAVDKGGDRWEVGRDKSTKVTGTLKVGAKVTIEYLMTATDVETKADKK